MADGQTIVVQLPGRAQPALEDVELLRGIFEAIATLGCAPAESAAEQALTAQGWAVRTRIGWIAEARKDEEFEEVTAASKAEALERLQELVRADRVLSPV